MATVFPSSCLGCGAAGTVVCDACASTMRWAAPASAPPAVLAWRSVFAYEGMARELIARIKYRNHRAAIGWLGKHVQAACGGLEFDLVTWPPTTGGRRRARGFDHAALLARHVARSRGAPVRSLLRRVDERPQTGRNALERRSRPPEFEPVPSAARMLGATRRCVLLVDDVATTGATLDAAARALRAMGAISVVAATAARALPPGARGS